MAEKLDSGAEGTINVVKPGATTVSTGPLQQTYHDLATDVTAFQASTDKTALGSMRHRDFYSRMLAESVKKGSTTVLDLKDEVTEGNIEEAAAVLKPLFERARKENQKAPLKLSGIDTPTAEKLKVHPLMKAYHVEAIATVRTREKLAAAAENTETAA